MTATTKTLLTVYFDHKRGWMVYGRHTRNGRVVHEDYTPAGMPRDSMADEVAKAVAACNPGCVVDVDEERCGT